VNLAGTTLRSQAKGEATVERWRKRNTSEIDISLDNMIPAYNFGADYTTYVLWAITPAGQVDNLGEFRLSGGSARLKTATAYQTFALIVTAEPHYLVRLPSRKVILENLAPNTTKVQVQASEVFFTGDSGKYYADESIPSIAERDYNKTPMELLQARRAVQIARLADGERYAAADYSAAVRSLDQAELAFRSGQSVHEVGRISRESISMAVRARDVSEERALAAERRAEIARRDEEVRRANETASSLDSRLAETETRLRASELARGNAETQLSRALADAADAKAENRRLIADNNRLEDELDRIKRDFAAATTRITNLESQLSGAMSRLGDVTSKAEAAERAEQERARSEAKRRDFAALQAELSRILNVKPNSNGFVASLTDNFFVSNQTSLALPVKAKMDALGRALAQHPDVMFTVEGHSDERPTAEDFALGRAQSVAEYIAAFGVSRTNFKVESRGAGVPIAQGRAATVRAKNRRVELVFIQP
ncbi:MAG TPA: OmpA family protein, partial [Blastocatellia bacterium]|nr:OmpA family protein [Blastocatellia bacterium]